MTPGKESYILNHSVFPELFPTNIQNGWEDTVLYLTYSVLRVIIHEMDLYVYCPVTQPYVMPCV